MSDLKITFAGQTFTFEPGQTVRIGRSPDNAVIVSDPIVSRDHARVTWRSGGWVLDDLGKGRTFVGGLPIASVTVHQAMDVRLATRSVLSCGSSSRTATLRTATWPTPDRRTLPVRTSGKPPETPETPAPPGTQARCTARSCGAATSRATTRALPTST